MTPTVEELARRASKGAGMFWSTLPHCCGYPNCDGDLEGEKHSEDCPLFHMPDLGLLAFAEAYAERAIALAVRAVLKHINIYGYSTQRQADEEILAAAMKDLEGK